MKNQVECALKEINRIGYSKREAKINGDAGGIHSIKYYRDIQGTSIRFAEFCKREYSLRSIYQLTEEHMKGYVDSLIQKGVTKGYLINVESHLQKLQCGMQMFSDRMGKPPVHFISTRRILPAMREQPQNRSYTKDEIACLEREMSSNVRSAMYMSLNLGLRSKEVSNIRVEHIVKGSDGSLQVKIEQGKGITKGGRFRDIPVPKSFEPTLNSLIQGKLPYQKIIGLKEGTLRSGLDRAAKRSGILSVGWHGFRHTYARERINSLLSERKDEGRAVIERMLENRSSGKKIDAGFRDWDKTLLNQVKDAINVVHHELGHGDNRWGLVQVYMS